jgi:hypothetical protein
MTSNYYDKIIDISTPETLDNDSWRLDERYGGTYSEGAREKDFYRSPATPSIEVIKSDWQYLFKLSRSWCLWQFWGEIIAYRLGCLINVEVPPSHVGYNHCYKKDDSGSCPTYGALIEWFYNPRSDLYFSGGQIMSADIPGYDRVKGKQHNFASIKKFFTETDFLHWAGVLTLDTLIANTDRHHDNWGVIVGKRKNPPEKKFSPAFDNGTALEYGIKEENFSEFQQEAKMNSYLNNPKRAKHHMKWSLEGKQKLNFYDFMSKLVLSHPETKDTIASHLNFERHQVEEILAPLCGIVSDPIYALTSARLDFIIGMIFRRKSLLENVLAI